jgi:aminopeptidase N
LTGLATHFLIMLHSIFADSPKSFQLPGSRPHYNPDRPGQVEHIFLDLILDIPRQHLQGHCHVRLNPVRADVPSLELDAVDLEIRAVSINGKTHEYAYDGEKLQIKVPEKLVPGKAIDIDIAYAVTKPQRGIYFILPSNDYPHKPTQVWTQGEDEDSRFWFPCFDYPGQLATSEIRVSVPKDFLAVSNGKLLKIETGIDNKLYHWQQEQVHPTYLMTLAVGRFAQIQDTWNDKPINYYVEKGREDQGRLSMGKTPRMVEFFSQKFGYPYPFAEYNQVCVDDFIFGGMENTGTTLLTDRCLLDERASLDNWNTESLVAHELAHQWFGDLVVIKHWSHAWIKEGMASYAEVLWTGHEYDEDEAAYYMLGEMESYLSEDSDRYRRPIVTNIYREAIELYDRHLYEKGACVYHMIRAELGDELFDKFVHTFVKDNAHKTVETIDVLRAIDKATGRNLAFLFDQFVYRGGHPDYKIAYSWDADTSTAQVTVTQTQAKEGLHVLENDLFDLKMPIAFGYIEGEEVNLKTFKVRIFEKEQVLYFPLATKPNFISFDPGNYHLKTVELAYGLAELTAQLEHDPDPISRIYAARALAEKGNLAAVEALGKCLAEEEFWAVRLEAAEALAGVQLDRATEILIAEIEDEDPFVRRSIVICLGKLKTAASYTAVKNVVINGDDSYYVEAAACSVLGGFVSALADQRQLVQDLLAQVLNERSGWNEVVRGGAISGLAKMTDDPVALGMVMAYTAAGTPQPLRLAAIRALGAVSVHQAPVEVSKALDRLQELARESFFLTQVSVVSALKQMTSIKAIGVLQGLSTGSPDGRVQRMAAEAIQVVQKNAGTDPALKQLRQELDEVKKANQDLRSRLETLEAKDKKPEESD